MKLRVRIETDLYKTPLDVSYDVADETVADALIEATLTVLLEAAKKGVVDERPF